MTNKQSNLQTLAHNKGVNIINIEEYQNKDSILQCSCLSQGHKIEGTVSYLLKTDFECLECLHLQAVNVNDNTPFLFSP